MKNVKIIFDERNNKHLRRVDFIFAVTIFALVVLLYLHSSFIARYLDIDVKVLKLLGGFGVICLLYIEKLVTYFVEKKIKGKH